MRILYLSFLFLLVASLSYSQAPFSFNFQGLARDAAGDPISDQEISLLISLISGFENGQIEFQEEHIVRTDDYGVFAIQIGTGDLLLGNLRNIDWGDDTYFIRTEMDPEGGEDYINLGTSRLNSVPYALFAAEAGNAASGGGDDDGDPTNELQALSISGKSLTISQGNTVDLSGVSNDADADPQNELQLLGLSGNTLSLSNGNSVVLPDGGGNNTDNQILSFSNNSLSISGGNSVNLSSLINDADADPGNELQVLSLNGNTLSLSNGNAVNLGTSSSPWSAIQDGIAYDGGNISHLNDDGSRAIRLRRRDNGRGIIEVFGENARKIDLNTTVDNAGLVRFFGTNGNLNILLSSIAADGDKAWIGLYDENGALRGASFVASSGRGGSFYNGPNGNGNIDLTALGANTNHGFILVRDEEGKSQAGMYVDESGNGRLFADFVDNFVENPTKSSEYIRYSMIQGPESAAYLRGTGQLQRGQAKIRFPAHFQALIDEHSLTVMITPLSAKSKGIAVVEKGKEGFKVQELLDGLGDYKFDWEVKGVRVLDQSLKSGSSNSYPQEAQPAATLKGAHQKNK